MKHRGESGIHERLKMVTDVTDIPTDEPYEVLDVLGEIPGSIINDNTLEKRRVDNMGKLLSEMFTSKHVPHGAPLVIGPIKTPSDDYDFDAIINMMACVEFSAEHLYDGHPGVWVLCDQALIDGLKSYGVIDDPFDFLIIRDEVGTEAIAFESTVSGQN